jgi:hypothetical protein
MSFKPLLVLLSLTISLAHADENVEALAGRLKAEVSGDPYRACRQLGDPCPL